MNSHILVPLVQAGAMEEAKEAVMGGMRFLPEPKNYAEVEKLQPLWREIYDLTEAARRERQPLEEEWEAIRRMNLMVHDTGQAYFGRSNAYLPLYRRSVQTLISTTSRGLFPSDEYLDVTLLQGTGDPEVAKPYKLYMQWEIDTNARLRTMIKPFIAQFFHFGTSPLKVWYKKDVRQVGGPGIVQKTLLGVANSGYVGNYGMTPKCIMDGLAVSPRNLFNWYVWPVTSESVRDAMMVFEDIDVSMSYVQSMVQKGRWIPDAIPWFAEHVDAERKRNELMQSRGMSSETTSRNSGAAAERGTVTEIWTYGILPSSAYTTEESKKEVLPIRLVMVGDKVVEATRNPFFHQQFPYLAGRYDWEPGFFYGVGAGRTLRPLQYLVNDFANQSNDAGNYGLNPIAKMNPGLLVGPPKPLKPGGVVYLTDIEKGLSFDRPPIEQMGFGMQMVQALIAMGMDFNSTPPIMQGNPKGAKTATQSQILQKNSQMPIQDIVEDLENDVLIPLMHMAYANAQQFRDGDVMAAVAGQNLKISPEQLALDASFRWMASSQAVNNQQRAQQAIMLIQATLPVVPLLMQQGYVVDYVALIRRIFVDGFGYRGFSEFIRKDPIAMMMLAAGQQGAGGQPGQGGGEDKQDSGAQQEQGGRVRSALEQVYGAGESEMAPGEGEDFMGVRQNADALAGGQGGGGFG